MFNATELEKYAEVLVWAMKTARRGSFKKGDIVLLRFDPPALPLAETLYGLLHDQGYNPVARQNLSGPMELAFYEKASPRRLMFRPPGEQTFYENLSGEISIMAPESLTRLSRVEPEVLGRVAQARKPMLDILGKREREGLLGRTVCLYPTAALAEAASLAPADYAERLKRACLLTTASPVGEWKRLKTEIDQTTTALNALDAREYVIEAESFELRLAAGKRRRWLGLTGRNIPSCECYTSPNWRGVEGLYHADLPSWRRGGVVDQVWLEFKKGQVTRMKAEKGEDLALEQLALDVGSGRVGEFSLTDRRFSRIDAPLAHTLLDENFGGRWGNCHIALGSAYAETYDGDRSRLNEDMKNLLGFNSSDLHWDLVNTERKKVTALLNSGEGRVIYEDGEFRL